MLKQKKADKRGKKVVPWWDKELLDLNFVQTKLQFDSFGSLIKTKTKYTMILVQCRQLGNAF